MTDQSRNAPEPASVTAARIEVARCRGEMLQTVSVLQSRLAPRTLATEAWTKAKTKGADLAEEAVDVVAARPVAVGGVAAAVALFLVREPLKNAALKIYDAAFGKRASDPEPAALTPPTEPTHSAPRRAPPDRVRPKTEIV